MMVSDHIAELVVPPRLKVYVGKHLELLDDAVWMDIELRDTTGYTWTPYWRMAVNSVSLDANACFWYSCALFSDATLGSTAHIPFARVMLKIASRTLVIFNAEAQQSLSRSPSLILSSRFCGRS